MSGFIFVLRTTVNREDKVLDFITANVNRKNLHVYSIFRPHGMRGYIFIEAEDKASAEEAYSGVPYTKGILQHPIPYSEIEGMLEQVKAQVNIQKGDIVEIISGPGFKGENAKVIRIDKDKEEVIVELLEAAVPIPITVHLDSVKVIRREGEKEETDER